jgi:hypothetical protein
VLFPSAADPVAIDSAQASYTLLAGALATLVVFGFVVAPPASLKRGVAPSS